MKRLLLSATLLLSASAFAQTTVDITTPNNAGLCSYVTGPVSTGTTAGHLQATATSMTGAGCNQGSGGTGAVTFGPASPLNPSSQTLGSNTGTVNFTFQPLNATSCTGAITGAAGGAFSAGTTLCNNAGATTCNQLVTAPASFTNTTAASVNYDVAVACTGAAGSAVSHATVTAQAQGTTTPPPGACQRTIANSAGGTPFTALSSTNTTINYTGGGSHTVDPTSFQSWYNGVAWPGFYGLNAAVSLPVINYVSLQFKVPDKYFSALNAPNPLYGNYTVGDTGFSVPVSMTISSECGDFSSPSSSGSTVLAGCYINKGIDGQYIQWSSTPSVSSCSLRDGQTYYLNFITADISGVTHGGGTATSTKNVRACPNNTACSVNIVDGTGTWSGFVPQ